MPSSAPIPPPLGAPTRAIACALAILLLGCPSPADDDDDVSPFDCTMGIWHEDGTWQEAEGADAEMLLGIQGWLWISAQLRTGADGPTAANVRFSGEIDGASPFGGSQPNVPLSTADGERYSDEIQVRLVNEDGTAPYIDAQLALEIRATSGTRECIAAATVTLKDDDPCLHTGGEPQCGDDDDSS